MDVEENGSKMSNVRFVMLDDNENIQNGSEVSNVRFVMLDDNERYEK